MSCPPLTDAEKAAIKARITKLEAAYDAILSGTSIEEFVDQNGEKVRYGKANISGLLKHINELRAMIDCGFARAYRPRPMGFVFPRQ